MKLTLGNIEKVENSETALNNNFDSIEQELQNKVLYRNNPTGEPNAMETNLDMNSKRILNLPAPVANTEPVRLQELQALESYTLSTSVQAAAATATTKASEASVSASNASASELNAQASASQAATSASTAVAANLAGMRVMGLVGNVNVTTPLTKFDLSASMVTLRDATGMSVTRYNTGSITCDLGLAGSAANGRDQAGAFTANSWIYLYFIWNGTTLATIASTSATAPTLPTGYTHYAFATALRWNASSNIVPCYVSGSFVSYRARQSLISSGASTSEASLSLSALIPPNSLRWNADLFCNNAPVGSIQGITLRLASGADFMTLTANASQFAQKGAVIPNVNQNVIYQSSNASTTLNAFVEGYAVPNGDA